MGDDKELMDVFLEEAYRLIHEMRRELSSLSVKLNPANLANLFRYAHTLKGSSDSVGFSRLSEIAILLQEIFRAAKDAKLKIDADIIPLLSQGVEACQALLNGEETEEFDELLEQLEQLTKLRVKSPVG
jgi:two-component system chemotaxis sensor kinase CheA